MHFADRVIETCRKKKSRLVVGLDPHWDRIPPDFKNKYLEVEETLVAFLSKTVAVTTSYVAAYKPQVAFFEQYGLAGMRALNRLLGMIRKSGGIILTDAKRNDIGSTAEAYARAFFGDTSMPPGFPSDALTVNGYLGSDGILPFIKNHDNGIFVLVKTSNPSSGELQDLPIEGGKTLAHSMAEAVNSWNEETVGESGYGNVGAVIGATYPDHMRSLRGLMPRSLILVPGYGAQGGSKEAIKAAFNKDGYGALINSSRGILFPKDWPEHGFDAIENAAAKARDEINTILLRR
ncbi:MAG: orotidine-5'-phosphate decarboxylase [Acidobacteriota bacterium]|nr:orotidine-5'-phosphate decarboxylase [Acidobacteriota bacterium]